MSRLSVGDRLVIWDFDGTILDTEWPAFDAARVEYERQGVELDFAAWQATIGSANHEPWWHELKAQVGDLGVSDDELVARFRAHKNAITDSYDLLPGVRTAFERLDDLGVRAAMASSSPIDWVERHTKRHGLWPHFVAVATSTDVGVERTKPHPDLFVLAAERAGVDAAHCVVVEDSANGVRAAKAAGMAVLAVPNRITAGQDFGLADRVVDSLADVSIDLVFDL